MFFVVFMYVSSCYLLTYLLTYTSLYPIGFYTKPQIVCKILKMIDICKKKRHNVLVALYL